MSELQPGTVTVADLYREMSGMRAEVGSALTELKVIAERNKGADQIHTDHETRIRMLERFRWTLAGVSLAGGGIAGYIGYLLGHVRH